MTISYAMWEVLGAGPRDERFKALPEPIKALAYPMDRERKIRKICEQWDNGDLDDYEAMALIEHTLDHSWVNSNGLYTDEYTEGLEVEVCPECKGSGFSGYGTGYGDVCGNCGGQKQLPR